MKDARISIGYSTRVAFAEALGMSSRIIAEIENARRESYSDQTLWRIEDTLGWQRGTAEELLHGERVSPALIFPEPGCPVTAGAAEYQQLADKLRTAANDALLTPLERLTDAEKILLLTRVFGVPYSQIDLLTEYEAVTILGSMSSQFRQLAYQYQLAKPRAHNEPLPKGDTRADRINAERNHVDNNVEYVGDITRVAAFDPARHQHPHDIDEDEADQLEP